MGHQSITELTEDTMTKARFSNMYPWGYAIALLAKGHYSDLCNNNFLTSRSASGKLRTFFLKALVSEENATENEKIYCLVDN